jgi:hypothetical protein
MKKIADKVNDGLSRTPDETIENPVPTTISEPSSIEDQKTLKTTPTFQTQTWVEDKHRNILINEKNPLKAEAFYQDAVERGLAVPRSGDLK